MASEFAQLEMMTIVMGNFQQIKNFKARTQKVLRAEIAEEGKSQEGRRKLIDMAMKVLKDIITLPQQSRDSIYEQFDPVLITTEILESKVLPIFNELLDYEGDDPGFVKLVRERGAEVMVKIISEIEEGFIEGINDVLPFIKANIEGLLMASAPPA